jgi:1-acyl-sn-glycerol-3-phosphate acyltransferase
MAQTTMEPTPTTPAAEPAAAERISHWIALKGILRTLGISAPTVWESLTGRLHMPKINARFQNYCQAVLDDAEIQLTVEGQENARNGAIYMSNHQSLYDIPAIGAIVPGVRMVTKAELFKVPVWGQALKASGFVSINRRNRTSAIESLKEAAAKMKAGTNIWISPEGTRSRTGELAEFKKGGFVMAIETGATIVPVTITGTYGVLPPKTSGVRLGRQITVRFHPPIDAGSYTLENKEALMADVRTAISGSI